MSLGEVHEVPVTLYLDSSPMQVAFDWPCLWLSWNFFRQGVLKQFLTEGTR